MISVRTKGAIRFFNRSIEFNADLNFFKLRAVGFQNIRPWLRVQFGDFVGFGDIFNFALRIILPYGQSQKAATQRPLPSFCAQCLLR